MKTSTKAKIVSMSTGIMIFTILFILLWFVIFITTSVFDLKVFEQKTSEFFFMSIMTAVTIVACAAFLSISLNMGIIADSKIKEMQTETTQYSWKKILLYFSGSVVLIIALLFFGDFLTKNYEKTRLISESKNVIERYKKSVDKIGYCLSDEDEIGAIPDILAFFSELKKDFQSVDLITNGKFEGQTVFLLITSRTEKKDLKKPYFNRSFYKCNKQDCDYLESVLNKGSDKILFYSQDSGYYLYEPIKSKGKKYILLFSKFREYGRMGS